MIFFGKGKKRWTKTQMGYWLDRAVTAAPERLLRVYGFRIWRRPAAGTPLWFLGDRLFSQANALAFIRKLEELR